MDANPNPKLVSSLGGRGAYYPPNLKLVWGLGEGVNYHPSSPPQTSILFGVWRGNCTSPNLKLVLALGGGYYLPKPKLPKKTGVGGSTCVDVDRPSGSFYCVRS